MKYDADGKEISGIADSGAMMTPVPEGSAAGETMMTPVPAYGVADGTMMTPVSVDGAGVTEVTMTLLPDSGEPIQRPTQVTSEQVRELTPTMTREEVLSFLGDTQDIGSGIYIYIYKVDGEALLRIPFASDEAQLGVTGEELLKTLSP